MIGNGTPRCRPAEIWAAAFFGDEQGENLGMHHLGRTRRRKRAGSGWYLEMLLPALAAGRGCGTLPPISVMTPT
jgi:hypothetical protein